MTIIAPGRETVIFVMPAVNPVIVIAELVLVTMATDEFELDATSPTAILVMAPLEARITVVIGTR